jgi:deazaflavin-dependent oxidoreductase (nitroreductase family)
MNDDVRRALDIDETSTLEDRIIDITTTGRRSNQPRRIEIAFYRLGDDVYLSGIPGPSARHWLNNLAAHPQFMFHLKRELQADLPATATVITDPVERRRIFSVLVDEFNRRNGPGNEWPEAILEDWVAQSPLAKVTFD